MNATARLADYFAFYVTTLIFFAVGAITTSNLSWYRGLILPSWMPSDLLVAVLWGILFLFTALSYSILWKKHREDPKFTITTTLYMGNGLLILLWNYLFFGLHNLTAAAWVSFVVGVSVLAIFFHVFRISRNASYLLTPYLVWVIAAIYLNHVVATLNP
jgi:benzodiazapine receptor